jgi:hypothetical protein
MSALGHCSASAANGSRPDSDFTVVLAFESQRRA